METFLLCYRYTAYGAHKHSIIVIGYVRYIRLIRRTYDIKLVLTGLRTMKKQILSNTYTYSLHFYNIP